MELKVGDKVRFVMKSNDGVDWLTEGKDYIVEAIEGDDDPTWMGGKVAAQGFVVICDTGEHCYCRQDGDCYHGDWELVSQ